MKKYLLLVFLLLIPQIAYAVGTCGTVGGKTGTSPYTAETAEYADVADCVTDVEEGATINLPTDTATWGSNLAITKGVTIIGAGVGSTVITAGVSGYIVDYSPSTPANNTPYRLSGITFNLNTVNTGVRVRNYSTTRINKVVIDHISLLNASSANAIHIVGSVDGVAHNNYLETAKAINQTMEVLGLQETSWANFTWTPGSGQGFYFEDNVFKTHNMLMASGQGGMWVARYNTITNLSSSTIKYFDAHGNQPAVTGNMGMEIYGNNMDSNGRTTWLVDQRGGKGMVFFNKLSASAVSRVRDEYDESIGPAGGKGYIQAVNDTYHFNNIAGSSQIISSCTQNCENIPENTNWWTTDTTFDGTTGVGCGTRAQRPGTCTAGVAYWETDQSCSTLTDYTGASPTTPIAGTLYKCTATNTWTAYYTPYTYPHPLRGETDETAPTATWEIDSTGLIATATFSESVNATTKTGVSFTGSVTGAITATYKDGMPGAIVRYDLNKAVQQADTVVVDYTTPGDGIKDLAGNALADISDGAVTNGSTQNSPPLVTLTIGAHTGATVNVYPGINCGSTCGPVEYDNGTVLTLSVQPMSNYTGCTIAGTGCGASTTMSEARTCTVTCTKISPDVTLGSGAAVTIGSGAVGTLY